MREPIASLSLDLDNKWSYLRTLGPGHWEDYPCYLDLVTPRIIETMRRFDLGMTVFAVGRDLETRSGQESIGSLAEAGCEIGNHSYHHYPWLHTLSRAEQRREITDTHQAIQRVTGVAPRGFRGPGFSTSETLLDLLTELDYAYDSSSLPAVTAPLARLYCAANALWTSGPRGQMFGAWTDAFRPLRPHRVDTPHGPLTELPVTTMPLLRTPIHMTYLMHLSQYSPVAARGYLRAALRLCRLRGVGPSMLLHPLDFLGGDECPQLAWFPGMRLARGAKQEQLCRLMDLLGRSFQITSLAIHAGVPAVAEPGRVEVMPLEAVAVEAAAE